MGVTVVIFHYITEQQSVKQTSITPSRVHVGTVGHPGPVSRLEELKSLHFILKSLTCTIELWKMFFL